VVERDRAGEVGKRAVLAKVVEHRLQPAEHAAIAPAEVGMRRRERLGDAVAGADHVLEEAVEEDRMACLVDLLRREEVLLLLLRRGVDVGRGRR
jgi:hypothetical protein